MDRGADIPVHQSLIRLIVVLLALACAPSIHAQTAKDVRIGYSQFPPFSSTTSTGVAEGFSIDAIRMLLEPQGYRLTFVPYNNPGKILDALAANDIDMTTVLADNAERRQFGSFTDSVTSIEIRIFVSADATDPPATLADLLGLRIGAIAGSITERLLEDIEGVLVVPYERNTEVIYPLLSGEIDALIYPVSSFLTLTNAANLSHRIQPTEIVLRDTPLGFLIEPGADALMDDLNAAISRAIFAQDFSTLHRKWFAPRAAPVTLRERYVVAGAVAVALAALLYWVRLHYIVLARARRLDARARLLSRALDATGLALVIFDDTLRPVYWNDAFRWHYPRQITLLERGLPMKALVAEGFQNAGTGAPVSAEQAQDIAVQRVAALRQGERLEQFDHHDNGTVFRRVTMALPDRQFAMIASDVTELLDTQRGLEGARRSLEIANQKLIEFNRVAAHDLVAPLRNLRNLHRWIRDDFEEGDVALDAEAQENFDMIDKLFQRLSKMVEDLLAYSQTDFEHGTEAFDPTDRFRGIIELSNISDGFRVSLPHDVPKVVGNKVAFDVVLRNLISNAVKHHDLSAGLITIRASVATDRCVFEVEDDGPGIPEAALEKVFEPFTRLKSRDEGAGTGLGLAFIKQRVAEWGGSVTAISVDGQRGTTFRFDMPLAEEDPPKAIAS